jgi:flagellar biosynthetic protein FliP
MSLESTRWLNRAVKSAIALSFIVLLVGAAYAQPEPPSIPIPSVEFGIKAAQSPQDVALTLQILALLTVLSLAPAIVLMLTSFTRILVVLSFVRSAIGVQQMPSNQILVTLALFLTFFTMAPVWQKVYDDALDPYLRGEISAPEALNGAVEPVRAFMLKETREGELSLMVSLADLPRPQTPDDLPTRVLIPAFMLSELKIAFQMGVVIFIPFIVVDMIVASVLMSMGMIMLPPMLVSLPFKVLLFVMADGWDLVVSSLVSSFR